MAIPTNADLNDYKNPGIYYLSSDSIATSVSNTPVNYGGILEVYSGVNSLVQRYTSFGGVSIFQRRFQVSQNTWQSWYKFEGTIMQQ